MAYTIFKAGDTLPTSKYKGVSVALSQHKRFITYIAEKQHKKKRYRKIFQTEREAALGYDKMCLSLGLQPVNILKPMKK